MSLHTKGILLAIIGVVILSPDALVIRLIEADNFAMVSARAGWVAAAVALLVAVSKKFRAGFRWKPLLFYSVFFAAGLVVFPLSIKYTYAANTLVILAAMPIFAAIGARVFLREQTAPMVWATALVIFFGIAVIFSGSGSAGDLLGNVLALVTAVVVAASTLIIRRYQNVEIAPGMAMGGLWACLLFAGFADWSDISVRDHSLIALDGVMIMALSFLFITRAARYMPPAEMNLFFLLETVLGPFWVWLVLNENPPTETLWAGSLIIIMLAVYGIWAYRRAQNPQAVY